jgi:signal transduction histidine kinase
VLASALALGGALFVRRSMRRQLADRQSLVDANQRWDLGADAAGIGLFDWRVGEDRFELDERAAALCGIGDGRGVTLRRTELRQRVHPDDQLLVRDGLDRAISAGGVYEDRYRILLDDGTVRHLEAIARMRDGGSGDAARMVGILRDVSAEVAQSRLALEKAAAERATRLRIEFLSRLSHELRTPLNAVLGVAQLLAIDPSEPLSANQSKRVKILLESGEQLLRLVEDVLDITRIDSGALQVENAPTDIVAVVRAGLDIIEPERASFGIRIDDRMPHRAAMVKGDRQRLQQVFVNLLSNGCRFNSRGGLLMLSYREDETHAWVTVADEGGGLSLEQQAQLFQPFKRLTPSSEASGSGLGLVVAKLLIEQMHGSVSVESEPGRGSAFTVKLPRA